MFSATSKDTIALIHALPVNVRDLGLMPSEMRHPRPIGYNGNTCCCGDCVTLTMLYVELKEKANERRPE